MASHATIVASTPSERWRIDSRAAVEDAGLDGRLPDALGRATRAPPECRFVDCHEHPVVEENFGIVILVIIALSVVPVIIELWRSRAARSKQSA